jgi:hypothetical protein
MATDITGGTNLSLLPGQKVRIGVTGYFARTESFRVYNEDTKTTETKELLRGFYVEDEEVGEISAPNVPGTSVIYTHKKAKENTVWFVARTEVGGLPEMGRFRVISVPVHDHSTITTGGPAFATYANEESLSIEEES